jgi:hypothetical protein
MSEGMYEERGVPVFDEELFGGQKNKYHARIPA